MATTSPTDINFERSYDIVTVHAGVVAMKGVRLTREGRLLKRRALYRERDKPLRDRKIQVVLEEGTPLRCELRSFGFTAADGEPGDGYIEVHHRLSLHVSGVTESRKQILPSCTRTATACSTGAVLENPGALQHLCARR
ncbi:hypothetical protein ABZ484_06945 [Streptomyces sp. NPDC006393]|uniref:hypothetical protein n=1 Tax=Streptomyces sp. NPDC006393 TaxID=3156763 RepID=UPI0033DECBCA